MKQTQSFKNIYLSYGHASDQPSFLDSQLECVGEEESLV